jgi:hypothetical protein
MGGNPLVDAILSGAGRMDVPLTALKLLGKAMADNTQQLGELAEIGALRQEPPPTKGMIKSVLGIGQPKVNWRAKAIEWMDRNVRLVMDDTYQKLAQNGYVENTETARREFVNQAGQYNKMLQGTWTRALRDYGVSPFITAGKTYTTLGVRNVMLDPGVPATSALRAGMLRADIAAKWFGTLTALGTLNYILTIEKGGGVMGRPGVPLGRLDTGASDEDGRPITFPFLDFAGFGRGLRVTGLKGAIDASRMGLTMQDAIDASVRDAFNSAISPLAGPAPRFLMRAFTGYPTAMKVGREAPVVPPGESQAISDMTYALREANPLVASAFDLYHGGLEDPMSALGALARQAPRISLQPSRSPEMMEHYPEIVQKAQLYSFTDDVIRQARKMPGARRAEFIEDSIAKLEDPKDQDFMRKALIHRRITW